MRLVDPVDGKALLYAAVGALHGVGLIGVKGALMLVDHDAVLPKGFVAIAVKLLGKEDLARAEGIG